MVTTLFPGKTTHWNGFSKKMDHKMIGFLQNAATGVIFVPSLFSLKSCQNLLLILQHTKSHLIQLMLVKFKTWHLYMIYKLKSIQILTLQNVRLIKVESSAQTEQALKRSICKCSNQHQKASVIYQIVRAQGISTSTQRAIYNYNLHLLNEQDAQDIQPFMLILLPILYIITYFRHCSRKHRQIQLCYNLDDYP